VQEFVTHALCLDARPACRIPSSDQGLDSLYRHVNASGRYGDTSFLIPVYGTSEFAQAFCRLSAVWVSVYR
jgi:RAB protein geranylgeranyltransferase component A